MVVIPSLRVWGPVTVCLCTLSVNASLTYVWSLVRLGIVCLNESERRQASKKLFAFVIGRDVGVYHY